MEAVIGNLLQKQVSPEAMAELVPIIASIGSDHYITTVANQAVKKPMTDEGFQKLIESLGGLVDSDHYLSQFLQTALERPNLSKQNIITVLNATSRIDSDHYVTEVLTEAAPIIKSMNDSSLKDAYRVAAKKIESETYYGRVLRAID